MAEIDGFILAAMKGLEIVNMIGCRG